MIKAYAVHEPKGELKPFEYDPGPLKDNEVEIDVEYCGICHSDLSMIDNEWGITQYPLVPGHEVVGTISSAGNKVNHLNVGDVVGLGWHSGYCMTCETCLAGDHNLCSAAESTIVARHGGFADKVRASAASVIKLPDTIDKAHFPHPIVSLLKYFLAWSWHRCGHKQGLFSKAHCFKIHQLSIIEGACQTT
jgi:alcohol/geraniol dehydrogenase (NADP+)